MRLDAEHMYCTRCGKPIKKEYLFCNHCGEPVRLQKYSVRADSEDIKAEKKIPDADTDLNAEEESSVSSDSFDGSGAGSFSVYNSESNATREKLKNRFLSIKRSITKNQNVKRVVYALIAGIVWFIGLWIRTETDIHVDWRGIFAIYTNGSNLKVDASVAPDERIMNLTVLGIMQNNGNFLYDALPQEYRDSSSGRLRSLMVEGLTNYTLEETDRINEKIGYEWKWRLRSKKLEEYKDEEKVRYDLEEIKYRIENTYDVEPIEVEHVSIVVTAKARSSIKTYSLGIPFDIFRSEYGWALDYESIGKDMGE